MNHKEARGAADVARERDLLRAGVELALPELDELDDYVRLGRSSRLADAVDASRAVERIRRHLTTGVE